jgi:GrpB-like predicted nucleotidyltransferase (UPF0157 family)
MGDERFWLVDDPAAAAVHAEILFESIRSTLRPLLPLDASIEHIGATAIPGCETKGDLDLVIRVSAGSFSLCRSVLSERYAANTGSVRTEAFAAFEDSTAPMPLGIQLVVVGSEFDGFLGFRDRLKADASLVQQYNVLKRAFHSKAHEQYRAAKAAFIESTMR